MIEEDDGMFILKLLGRVLLLPVWLLLGLCRVSVHLAVGICSVFHGLGKLFFGGCLLLALAFGMWQNAALFAVLMALLLVLVFAGAVLEVLLEEAMKWAWPLRN
jgi:uncharacterized membrane protein